MWDMSQFLCCGACWGRGAPKGAAAASGVSDLPQRAGPSFLVLDASAAREGRGRLDQNSNLQLLQSFRHLTSFFGSLGANFPSWGS